MKDKTKRTLGAILIIVGVVVGLSTVQDMFQFRVDKTASVTENKADVPKVSWQRTQGPGTAQNLFATVTPGEEIKFCGKAQVSSSSERPIYRGNIEFEAYEGVTELRSNDCWGKRVYCGSDACDSSDLVDNKGIYVGEVQPGETTEEKCFTINPQEQGLEHGDDFVTIMYIYDESYSLDECSGKPGGYPTLALDFWEWTYKETDVIDVEMIKTGVSVISVSAGAALLLLPKF